MQDRVPIVRHDPYLSGYLDGLDEGSAALERCFRLLLQARHSLQQCRLERDTLQQVCIDQQQERTLLIQVRQLAVENYRLQQLVMDLTALPTATTFLTNADTDDEEEQVE
jgi:hypothetical protein